MATRISIVDDRVILELKSVERLMWLHEVQLLTYLRLTECHIGLLINFNTVSLTDGIKRRVLSVRDVVSFAWQQDRQQSRCQHRFYR